jgi:ketosteroid isomerase-like protein
MNYKLCFIFFACILFLNQASAQKTIDGLIAVERAFAQYALDKNVKQAFLKFADTAGLQFDNGKPIKSRELWVSREENKSVLKWQPQFAEIAASGDFGYTTGPWTFQASDKDTIAGRGQYTTVWYVNANGEWKFLVDYGHNYAPGLINTSNDAEKIKVPVKQKATEQSLLEAQKAFNILAAISPQAAYQKYLSRQSILNFEGHLPIKKTFEQLAVFNDVTEVSFNIQGSGIASSGDMGYVYGATTYKEKTDNYVHIWRREKDGWKIAVAVVHL